MRRDASRWRLIICRQLLVDAPSVSSLLQLALAATPQLAEQRAIMRLMAKARIRWLPGGMLSQAIVSAPLRGDTMVLEHLWRLTRRRVEVLLRRVKVSDRDREGGERFVYVTTALAHLTHTSASATSRTIRGEWTRWPMQMIIDAARLVYKLDADASRGTDRSVPRLLHGAAFQFLELGLGLITGHGEDYAVEGVDALVSMSAALSLAEWPVQTSALHALNFGPYSVDPPVPVGPIQAVLEGTRELVEFARVHARFQTAFIGALGRMLQSVLADLCCDGNPIKRRSATQQRVRMHWRALAADMALLNPVESIRCWQVACPTLRPERFSRCARCQQAICAFPSVDTR